MPIIGKPSFGRFTFEDIIFISLLVLGIIVALLSPSGMIFYIVSFLIGVIFGRLWYKTRHQLQLKYFLMITCFIIGYIIGNSLTRYGNIRWTITMYVLGIVISYYANKRGYLRSIDF